MTIDRLRRKLRMISAVLIISGFMLVAPIMVVSHILGWREIWRQVPTGPVLGSLGLMIGFAMVAYGLATIRVIEDLDRLSQKPTDDSELVDVRGNRL